jgi:hypothetical protein
MGAARRGAKRGVDERGVEERALAGLASPRRVAETLGHF